MSTVDLEVSSMLLSTEERSFKIIDLQIMHCPPPKNNPTCEGAQVLIIMANILPFYKILDTGKILWKYVSPTLHLWKYKLV